MFIAAGAVRSLFDGTVISDIDMYGASPADVKEYESYLLKKGYCVRKETSRNAVYEKQGHIEIDVVRQWTGSITSIMDSFDFTVCKAALTLDGYLHTSRSFIEDCTSRILKVDGSICYPASTYYRIFKYIKYGYTIGVDTMQQILDAVKEI